MIKLIRILTQQRDNIRHNQLYSGRDYGITIRRKTIVMTRHTSDVFHVVYYLKRNNIFINTIESEFLHDKTPQLVP